MTSILINLLINSKILDDKPKGLERFTQYNDRCMLNQFEYEGNMCETPNIINNM